MAIHFDPIRPGDLITADLMNRLLDAVEGLDGRLTTVEQGGTQSSLPVILTASPLTPRIGETVTLSGRNFGVPIQRTVTIDGTLVSSTGNDSLISFAVPNLDQVTSSGKRVTISVDTTAGATSTEVVVFPFVPTKPTGDVWVSLKTAPSGSMAPGDHVFVYTVLGQVSLDETYDVQPTLDASGWTAVVVDTGGTVISQPTITIPKADPPGASVDVSIRVTVPAAGAASARLSVRVVAKHNSALVGLNGSGDTITRGAAAPPPQVGIQLTCIEVRTASDSIPANTTTTVSGPVTITPSTGYWRLTFRGHFDHAGSYNVVLAAIADSKWSQTFSLATPSTSKSLAVGADSSDQTVFVFIKSQAGATPADVTMTITKADDSTITATYSQAVHT